MSCQVDVFQNHLFDAIVPNDCRVSITKTKVSVILAKKETNQPDWPQLERRVVPDVPAIAPLQQQAQAQAPVSTENETLASNKVGPYVLRYVL